MKTFIYTSFTLLVCANSFALYSMSAHTHLQQSNITPQHSDDKYIKQAKYNKALFVLKEIQTFEKEADQDEASGRPSLRVLEIYKAQYDLTDSEIQTLKKYAVDELGRLNKENINALKTINAKTIIAGDKIQAKRLYDSEIIRLKKLNDLIDRLEAELGSHTFDKIFK